MLRWSATCIAAAIAINGLARTETASRLAAAPVAQIVASHIAFNPRRSLAISDACAAGDAVIDVGGGVSAFTTPPPILNCQRRGIVGMNPICGRCWSATARSSPLTFAPEFIRK